MLNKNIKPVVGVIMGSDSDMPVMKQAIDILDEFNIPYEVKITSAHRTTDLMATYSKTAYKRGIKVIIAQMPYGVPVATVAINNAKNAALLAIKILAVSDKNIMKKIVAFKKKIEKESLNKKIDL